MALDTVTEKKNVVDEAPIETHPEPPPPPNGGFQAWLQVAGAFFLFFNSWGLVNTFGAYQAYYETNLLQARSSSDISWIGSIQGFILIVFSIIAGPAFDQGYFRSLLVVGTFLAVFGTMMTSLATEYYQIFLAQGICVGLGTGCLFVPSLAIVATYFTTRRALATGITAAGGSVGATIYPIVFRKLQPTLGFGWATRVVAFLTLGTLLFSIAVMKLRLPPSRKSRSLIDPTAFKSVPFCLLCLGCVLSFAGLYVPFFYIIIIAEREVAVDADLSFYLLSIMNAGSVFGRIIPGQLADKFGSLIILVPFTIISAVLIYCLIAVHNLAGLVVFSVLFGFFSGACVSLPATVLAKMTPDMRLIGTRMGMSFTFAGLGFLIGTPIAGAIINVAENRFTGGLVFGASCIMASGVAFVGILVLDMRKGK